MKKYIVNLYGYDTDSQISTNCKSHALGVYLNGMFSNEYESGDFIEKDTGEALACFERESDENGGDDIKQYISAEMKEYIVTVFRTILHMND